jgi:hypothetical protein
MATYYCQTDCILAYLDALVVHEHTVIIDETGKRSYVWTRQGPHTMQSHGHMEATSQESKV